MGIPNQTTMTRKGRPDRDWSKTADLNPIETRFVRDACLIRQIADQLRVSFEDAVLVMELYASITLRRFPIENGTSDLFPQPLPAGIINP